MLQTSRRSNDVLFFLQLYWEVGKRRFFFLNTWQNSNKKLLDDYFVEGETLGHRYKFMVYPLNARGWINLQ